MIRNSFPVKDFFDKRSILFTIGFPLLPDHHNRIIPL
jgi:hypothetical protein